MKELDSLKGIGKVSGLKNKINPQNTFDTHQDELKTLITPDKSRYIKSENHNKDENTVILEKSKKVTVEKTVEDNSTEKKNIKVSINLDDEELKEGEYELFKGSLNKKDKKIDGDIFLVEKEELNKVDIIEDNEKINNDIIIDINDNEINSDDTDSIEIKNNMSNFLDEIK